MFRGGASGGGAGDAPVYPNEATALAGGSENIVILENPVRGTYMINATGDGYDPVNALDEYDNAGNPLGTKGTARIINEAGGELLEVETSNGEIVGE